MMRSPLRTRRAYCDSLALASLMFNRVVFMTMNMTYMLWTVKPAQPQVSLSAALLFGSIGCHTPHSVSSKSPVRVVVHNLASNLLSYL